MSHLKQRRGFDFKVLSNFGENKVYLGRPGAKGGYGGCDTPTPTPLGLSNGRQNLEKNSFNRQILNECNEIPTKFA